MIDSHCHLDHEPLISDLPNVIKRSKAVGIEKLLTISTSFKSFSKIKELIEIDKMIYGTIGIHPHETSTNIITSNEIIKHLSENSKIIGIGETGLDFYYKNSKKDDQIKILMHCFTGSKEFSKKLLKLNSFFSASGIITFHNSLDLQETFKSLPLDSIMIETDSPFLAPVPNRGKKNEPSFIDFTASKLAQIKGILKSEIIKITTNNFNRLFFK